MDRIVKALAALISTLPDGCISLSNLSGYVSVSVSFETDANARAAAQTLGIDLTLTGNETHEWLSGSGRLDGIGVMVFGRHHERTTGRSPDPEAVDAAIALAEQAVQP